jgi:hypothetical protein
MVPLVLKVCSRTKKWILSPLKKFPFRPTGKLKEQSCDSGNVIAVIPVLPGTEGVGRDFGLSAKVEMIRMKCRKCCQTGHAERSATN